MRIECLDSKCGAPRTMSKKEVDECTAKPCPKCGGGTYRVVQ